MKNKELLAGGLVRDLWFSDEDAFQRYMDQIHTEYKILEKVTRPNGALIVRLLTAYNGSPLIQLYEEV